MRGTLGYHGSAFIKRGRGGTEGPAFGRGSFNMSSPERRGARSLSDILGELFATRGYGRLRGLKELEDAWNAAVGEPQCHQTRVGEVRRGVLNVTVAHSTLLEELAAYQKPQLLAALRQNAPGTTVHDIRFRVGPIDAPAAASKGTRPPRPATHDETS